MMHLIDSDGLNGERLERLIARKSYSVGYENELKAKLYEKVAAYNHELLSRVMAIAAGIEYNHPGLSAQQYFIHPLRVACLVSSRTNETRTDAVLCSLLHNVFELSTITPSELCELVDPGIVAAVEVLTLDRRMSGNKEYLEEYYGKIASSAICSMVKIFDKYDNLFLLCLNPSWERRHKYITEIEEHLLPLVATSIPQEYEYFKKIIENTKEIGHLDKNKSIGFYGHDYT
jgi:(p)ppGpp synthase/HD superfamily hydrolase